MSRPLVFANGSMLVGLDHTGHVHDFYYPYVGLENHATARTMHHRIGVWVDGQYSWLDSGEWQITLDYEQSSLMGMTIATNPRLELRLEFHDFVDALYNVFCRNVHMINMAERERSLRIFFHQAFLISESNRGDTALYVPEGNYILDYKGRRTFLIYAQKTNGESFDQYSVGVHGIEGKAGTYLDAEDGDLSCNAVEHGRVDSTIRISETLPPVCSKRLHYWVAAAEDHASVKKIHTSFLDAGFQEHYRRTQEWWREWLEPAQAGIERAPIELRDGMAKSLLIMKSHVDRRGSILASADSEMLNYERDNYSYCWPRDAAYVLWPLIRLGYTEEARNFFGFARDTISEEGSMRHKYQPDRAVGSTWHPLVVDGHPEQAIQEDETAILLVMIEEYLKSSRDAELVKHLYPTLIQPAANFLEGYTDSKSKLPHPSYDLWEEKFLTHTYTVATVYGALKAAASMAELLEHPDDAIRWNSVAGDIQTAAHRKLFCKETGYFYKGFRRTPDGEMIYDTVIDTSSLYGAIKFGLYPVDHPDAVRSLETLETRLLNKSPSGGLPRYEHDAYHRSPNAHLGNPWFVTTLWLAQIYVLLDRHEEARELVDWTRGFMMKSGVLPEQIDPDNGSHRSVAPLIWSHAEYVRTILDIYGPPTVQ